MRLFLWLGCDGVTFARILQIILGFVNSICLFDHACYSETATLEQKLSLVFILECRFQCKEFNSKHHHNAHII